MVLLVEHPVNLCRSYSLDMEIKKYPFNSKMLSYFCRSTVNRPTSSSNDIECMRAHSDNLGVRYVKAKVLRSLRSEVLRYLRAQKSFDFISTLKLRLETFYAFDFQSRFFSRTWSFEPFESQFRPFVNHYCDMIYRMWIITVVWITILISFFFVSQIQNSWESRNIWQLPIKSLTMHDSLSRWYVATNNQIFFFEFFIQCMFRPQ